MMLVLFINFPLHTTRWFFNVIGDSRCPISDTWWQTETGGFLVDSLVLFDVNMLYSCKHTACNWITSITLQITPLPGAWPQKPGSATFPFFGVQVMEHEFVFSQICMYLFSSCALTSVSFSYAYMLKVAHYACVLVGHLYFYTYECD